jgi:hypothetical protein
VFGADHRVTSAAGLSQTVGQDDFPFVGARLRKTCGARAGCRNACGRACGLPAARAGAAVADYVSRRICMETTAQTLLREGRMIEGLQALVERYVGERMPARAQEALTTLAGRMRVRIRVEEEELFPRLEALVDTAEFSPTARMRRQHRVLLELVDGIELAIREGNLIAAAGDLCELRAALHTHLEEERRVLLPILGPDWPRA